MQEQFADVILPLPIAGKFTYRVPEELIPKAGIGKRVIVQFGQKKFYSAIVTGLSGTPPENVQVKEVISVLDESAVVFPENIRFWEWVSEYYCCPIGEVMKAAMPSGLKLESATNIRIAGDVNPEFLTEEEKNLLSIIGNGEMSIQNIQKRYDVHHLFPLISSLVEKKCIAIEEKINLKRLPRTESIISLSKEIRNQEDLNLNIGKLKNARKQEALLLHFCRVTHVFSADMVKEISRKELLKGTDYTTTLLNGLLSKRILEATERAVSESGYNSVEQGELNLLNSFQAEALEKIKDQFETKNTVLLHGVTSSGKTEIYTHLINEAILRGKQVLYLVPEISLTTQLVDRLKKIFGENVGVYHSGLNDPERLEIWERICNYSKPGKDTCRIILGARSAIFLPFQNPGLIVVDEEHENSYKQFDPAPRYHARDLAVLLGTQNKARVLLGTATPSFETYYNVKTGKFGLVELSQRYGNMELPEIIVSDLQRAYKRKQMKKFLTPELFDKISESLEKKEQVILFQNRRGFAPFTECMNCGWIPKCKNCDVTLTYHKYKNQLTCHYCGFRMQMPENCHECGSEDIKTRGMGTEKIEEELKQLFPYASIARMDLDSTRAKHALEKIIHNLESQKTDILVGTQMVTKGLDFEHVKVVGILNADNLINFPDFRAHERTFQLISQVSGRAGRKHSKGIVVIQTSQPEHRIIEEIRNYAFKETFTRQLSERKLFRYPPFARLIKIVVKHRNRDRIDGVSQMLASLLRENKQLQVLGPEFPLINRISLWYQKEIWIKLSRTNQLADTKRFILKSIEKTSHLPDNSGAAFNIDVDPM